MPDETHADSSAPAADTPAAPPHRYNAALADQIETRWQSWWAEHETFLQANPGETGFEAGKPKFYCLDMFPYPSGAGLHVGHPEGYTATDILCRYKSMRGFNVLHPMGWDAFGLPAEQYAIQTGVHPAETTRTAIDNFRRQLQRFGFGYDWSREFGTIDEGYYKWTQWIFLEIYNSWFDPDANKACPIAELVAQLESGDLRVGIDGELVHVGAAATLGPVAGEPVGTRQWHELSEDERRDVIDSQRLAYVGEQTVNWCPKLGTALANEEVVNGRSERGSHPVVRRPLKQWMFRITAYAQRLLGGLADVQWPESTKAMQTEWIGRSEGAEVIFRLENAPDLDELRVFTTRPDTVFGATYMVVAPEHPLVDSVLAAPAPDTPTDELRAYVQAARNRSDLERQEGKEKTGVFTGIHAVNPATGERIPVWTADYVLWGYGTGAIMAVPAHDTRDYAFAQKFGLAIRDVVYPRTILVMRWFFDQAQGDERTTRWATTLADLLGYVTSNDVEYEGFPAALKQIRDNPRDGGQQIDLERCVDDFPGAVGQQIGSTQVVWLDALESMGVETCEKAERTLGAGAFYAEFGEAYAGAGRLVNSTNEGVSLDGLPVPDAKNRIAKWLESEAHGKAIVNFKLRDWLFSRQRYWGEPFPIVWDERGRHHGVSQDQLPVALPKLADYKPIESDVPVPLLGKATDWVQTTAGEVGVEGLPADAPVTRETNTMPGWAGSCWYYLRYADAHNSERFLSGDADDYWMGEHGVDLYVGGAEHAVLHLLYARFWHMALHDLGHVRSPEPFKTLFHQGLITSFAYQRTDGSLVAIDEVDEKDDDTFIERSTGEAVKQVTAKMSKSLKNVVNPDDIIAEFGADTFRLYEMYMGPLDASKPWNTRDISGLHRFLQRAWRVCVDEETGQLTPAIDRDDDLERQLHRTIAKVGDDIEGLRFNTAIAAMIELVNSATTAKQKSTGHAGGFTHDQIERFALILAPFAPHMGEELWLKLGRTPPIARAEWPSYDEAMLTDASIEIPVQIMGKVRSKISVAPDTNPKDLEAIALADERIKELIEGKQVRKVIVVPGRMVNIVAN